MGIFESNLESKCSLFFFYIMAADLLKCYNAGCGKKYKESDNNDTICVYHPGPPEFHDLKKTWKCCMKTSMDWDDFAKIKGCTTGRHSNVKPKKLKLAKMPEKMLPQPINAEMKKLKVTSPQSMPKLLNPPPGPAGNAVCPPVVEKKVDEPKPILIVTAQGWYKCANFGCLKEYDPENNNEGDCKHHSGRPLFRDIKKWWTCCDAYSYDWDDFQKLPTCPVGKHKPKYKK